MSEITATPSDKVTPEVLVASDGVPLKVKLARTTAAARRRAFFLTLPLVLFVAISFVFPIGEMLFRSFCDDPDGVEVVAINDIVPLDQLSYLLRFDSVHQRPKPKIESGQGWMKVDGKTVKVFDARDPASGKNLGDLPEWNLDDLYTAEDSDALTRDLDWVTAESASFSNDYAGKLAELDSEGLLDCIKRYEKIEQISGRIMSFAGLRYYQQTTDAERGKFFADMQGKLTESSAHLVFFGLEINRIDDDFNDGNIAKSICVANSIFKWINYTIEIWRWNKSDRSITIIHHCSLRYWRTDKSDARYIQIIIRITVISSDIQRDRSILISSSTIVCGHRRIICILYFYSYCCCIAISRCIAYDIFKCIRA